MTSTALPPHTGAARVLEDAHRVLLKLGDVLWAARDNGEKMETVVAIEELRSVLDSIELEVVRDLDASRGVERLGWASTRDFVTAVAGEHKGAGPAMVRFAQAMEQPVLAPVAQAHRDGWLSTAKAHVIARAIDRLPPPTTCASAESRRCSARRRSSTQPTCERSLDDWWRSSTQTRPSGVRRKSVAVRSAAPTSAATCRFMTTAPAAPSSEAVAPARTHLSSAPR